jgi:pseudouridine synthase
MQSRLQKILSSAGISSRRAAEALIGQGRVTVNGITVTTLGTKADPDADDIRVDGRRVKVPAGRRYILLNKPRGYITSRSDPQRRPTVIDLLQQHGVRDYVYPVGRLDFESEGLLLLTSDGDLAAHLTHPRHGVDREYEVQVRGVPDRHTLERLARGVVIDGRRTAPAQVSLRKTFEGARGPESWLSLVIREGRHRQVRKMCEAVGHPVARLRRVRIGPLADPRLKPGQFRDLTPPEVAALKRAAVEPSGRTRQRSDLGGGDTPDTRARDRPASPTGRGVGPRSGRAARPRRRSPPDRLRRG